MATPSRIAWPLLLLLFAFLPSQALAQEKGKKDPYVVVETSGAFQVMRKSDVEGYKKRVDAEYKEEVTRHSEAKKEAAKNKAKFDEPKPVKPKVKTHGSGFETQAAANLAARKLEEKAREKAKKGS